MTSIIALIVSAPRVKIGKKFVLLCEHISTTFFYYIELLFQDEKIHPLLTHSLMVACPRDFKAKIICKLIAKISRY